MMFVISVKAATGHVLLSERATRLLMKVVWFCSALVQLLTMLTYLVMMRGYTFCQPEYTKYFVHNSSHSYCFTDMMALLSPCDRLVILSFLVAFVKCIVLFSHAL